MDKMEILNKIDSIFEAIGDIGSPSAFKEIAPDQAPSKLTQDIAGTFRNVIKNKKTSGKFGKKTKVEIGKKLDLDTARKARLILPQIAGKSIEEISKDPRTLSIYTELQRLGQPEDVINKLEKSIRTGIAKALGDPEKMTQNPDKQAEIRIDEILKAAKDNGLQDEESLLAILDMFEEENIANFQQTSAYIKTIIGASTPASPAAPPKV